MWHDYAVMLNSQAVVRRARLTAQTAIKAALRRGARVATVMMKSSCSRRLNSYLSPPVTLPSVPWSRNSSATLLPARCSSGITISFGMCRPKAGQRAPRLLVSPSYTKRRQHGIHDHGHGIKKLESVFLLEVYVLIHFMCTCSLEFLLHFQRVLKFWCLMGQPMILCSCFDG